MGQGWGTYRSVKFRHHPDPPLLSICDDVSYVFLGVDVGVVIGSLLGGSVQRYEQQMCIFAELQTEVWECDAYLQTEVWECDAVIWKGLVIYYVPM